MKQEVKAGQHDFRPNSPEQFTPVMGDFSLRLSLDLFPECWYDPTKFECNTSWNKGGGIGRYLSENNKDAILLAWRPTRNQNEFEAAIYRNDESGECCLRFMPDHHIVDGGGSQSDDQQIERGTCHAQGGLFERGAGCSRVLADAQNHCQDANTRHNFDKRVDAEAEEGKSFIGKTEEDGDQSLGQVVNNGEERKPESIGPVTVDVGLNKRSHLYS